MAEVDAAIVHIQDSGLSYEVGPFGTSVEGPKIAVQNLIDDLLSLTTCKEFLINVQYHVGDDRLSNAEKVSKFR